MIIEISEMKLTLDKVGHNSLLGSVLMDLFSRGYTKNALADIALTKVKFVIKSVHPEVDICHELFTLCDFFSASPDIFELFIQQK